MEEIWLTTWDLKKPCKWWGQTTNLNWWSPDFFHWSINSMTAIQSNLTYSLTGWWMLTIWNFKPLNHSNNETVLYLYIYIYTVHFLFPTVFFRLGLSFFPVDCEQKPSPLGSQDYFHQASWWSSFQLFDLPAQHWVELLTVHCCDTMHAAMFGDLDLLNHVVIMEHVVTYLLLTNHASLCGEGPCASFQVWLALAMYL